MNALWLDSTCSSTDQVKLAHCYGYISGALDGMNDSEVVGSGGKRFHITLSDEINDYRLVADMFHSWLDRHPEERDTDASAVILRVLLQRQLATTRKLAP
jgi:hypothetical protein